MQISRENKGFFENLMILKVTFCSFLPIFLDGFALFACLHTFVKNARNYAALVFNREFQCFLNSCFLVTGQIV